MNRHPLKGLACLVLTVAASHAHAQPATVVKLKNGESLDWPAVTFKPAMCDELGCGTPSPKPKIRPKDFCIYAICLPLDAKAVKTEQEQAGQDHRQPASGTFHGSSPGGVEEIETALRRQSVLRGLLGRTRALRQRCRSESL